MDFSFIVKVGGEQTSSRKGRAEIHACSLQLWVKTVNDFRADLPYIQPFTGKYIPNFAERSCVVCKRAPLTSVPDAVDVKTIDKRSVDRKSVV